MAVLPQRRHPALRAAADAAGRKLSSDDVQVVRAAYEALAEGGVEAMIEHIHDDFEGVVPPSMSAEPDTYHGHEGVRRYFRLFEETVEDLKFVFSEVIDDGDRVIVLLTMQGTGRGSGVPVNMDVASTVTCRDGKLWRTTAHRDLAEARAAR